MSPILSSGGCAEKSCSFKTPQTDSLSYAWTPSDVSDEEDISLRTNVKTTPISLSKILSHSGVSLKERVWMANCDKGTLLTFADGGTNHPMGRDHGQMYVVDVSTSAERAVYSDTRVPCTQQQTLAPIQKHRKRRWQ